MKKNLRIRVVESCDGTYWWYSLCDGNRQLIDSTLSRYKNNAIRGAKAIAKRTGIKYDSKMIKMHGC